MTGLGVIGLGAAVANYRKCKSNYDALKEKRDGLLAAVQMFNQSKDDPYVQTINTNPVDYMPGVSVTTLLRVANLVGKIFYVRTSIILANTGSQKIFIHKAGADCYINGLPVMVYSMDNLLSRTADNTPRTISQEETVNKTLNPGETMEIQLAKGVSGYSAEDMAALRDMICEAAGRKLITSCPKLNIEGGIKSDVLITWSVGESGTKTQKTAKKAGILRYCGEAGLS